MLKITALSKSARRETALSCGDIIRSVNGYPAVDELDLLYFAGETVLLEVEGKGEVRARADEIQVKSEQAIRTCHNHCTF